jgi:hypothetical protein
MLRRFPRLALLSLVFLAACAAPAAEGPAVVTPAAPLPSAPVAPPPPASSASAEVPAPPQASSYDKPPQNVLDVLHAPSPPQPSMSPTHETILLVTWTDYPPMARVAEPFLKLAGVRIEPRNHSRHDTTGGYGITPCAIDYVLTKVADGSPTRGSPSSSEEGSSFSAWLSSQWQGGRAPGFSGEVLCTGREWRRHASAAGRPTRGAQAAPQRARCAARRRERRTARGSARGVRAVAGVERLQRIQTCLRRAARLERREAVGRRTGGAALLARGRSAGIAAFPVRCVTARAL